jgi:hypothetical protein
VIDPTVGIPNLDPESSPSSDWLAVRMLTQIERHRSGYTGIGFDQVYTTQPLPIDVTTRRHLSGGAFWSVVVRTKPISELGATYAMDALGRGYFSVLYSTP